MYKMRGSPRCIGLRLPVLAGPLLHHEREGPPGLGALPQDGDQRGVLLPPPAHRQRRLQDGSVLLRRQGLRHAGAVGSEPRVLGGEAGRLRGRLSGSVVDPNSLNLNPDPEFWPNLDPDLGLGLCCQFRKKIFK